MDLEAITRTKLVDDKEKHHEKIYESKWTPSLQALAGALCLNGVLPQNPH